MSDPTLSALKRRIWSELQSAGVDEGERRREAELIVEHVTGWSTAEQVLRAGEPLPAGAAAAVERILEKRRRRVPLQYCLGYAYFRGLKLAVRPGAFIPRPDTETLVDVVLRHFGAGDAPHFGEIGPGSGAVVVSLLKALPLARATAVDISPVAAEVTAENALTHGVWQRLTVVTGDWRERLPCRLDAVVSNPPYIPLRLRQSLEPEVAVHEPPEALFGWDEDGLGFYRELAGRLSEHLLPGGLVAVEVGEGQAQAVSDIFASAHVAPVTVSDDLSGTPRVVSGCLGGL